MRPAPALAASALALLAACATGEANHLGNPLTWPATLLTGTVQNAAYSARRGQVEVHVKSNHPTLIAEIAAGGGPLLTTAMDLAGIPAADRPTRLIQLNADLGLYDANPGALVTALMVYGG
jgi:hypothetical protein